MVGCPADFVYTNNNFAGIIEKFSILDFDQLFFTFITSARRFDFVMWYVPFKNPTFSDVGPYKSIEFLW